MSEKNWAVEVMIDGEFVLSLESGCLSGKDLSSEEIEIIRQCANHLLAFVCTKNCSCGASLSGKSTICEGCVYDGSGLCDECLVKEIEKK